MQLLLSMRNVVQVEKRSAASCINQHWRAATGLFATSVTRALKTAPSQQLRFWACRKNLNVLIFCLLVSIVGQFLDKRPGYIVAEADTFSCVFHAGSRSSIFNLAPPCAKSGNLKLGSQRKVQCWDRSSTARWDVFLHFFSHKSPHQPVREHLCSLTSTCGCRVEVGKLGRVSSSLSGYLEDKLTWEADLASWARLQVVLGFESQWELILRRVDVDRSTECYVLAAKSRNFLLNWTQ